MLLLMQLIKFMNGDKKNIKLLQEYFACSIDEVNSEDMSYENIVLLLPDFLESHLGISLDMREREKESLIRVLKNNSWKSAFNIQGL